MSKEANRAASFPEMSSLPTKIKNTCAHTRKDCLRRRHLQNVTPKFMFLANWRGRRPFLFCPTPPPDEGGGWVQERWHGTKLQAHGVWGLHPDQGQRRLLLSRGRVDCGEQDPATWCSATLRAPGAQTRADSALQEASAKPEPVSLLRCQEGEYVGDVISSHAKPI